MKTRVQQFNAFEEMEYFRYLNYNFAESIIDLTYENAILKYPIDYSMIIEFRQNGRHLVYSNLVMERMM